MFDMARASRSGQMVPSTKASGPIIKPMARADSSMLMETSILVIGSTIRLRAMVSIYILTEPSIRVNGKTISNMETGMRHGQMVLVTRDNMIKVRNKVRAFSNGLMALLLTENFLRTISMATVNTAGPMVEYILVHGKTTKWKVKEFSPGLMADGMKENM